MEICIVCQVVRKELPAKFLYEDEEVLAFPDIDPVRPVHIIIIPAMHVAELTAVSNPDLFKKLFSVAQKMVIENGLQDNGYRIVVNGGGAQIIDHLHVHVMGPIKKEA